MELLYIIGFVIYIIYSVISAGKNAKNKGQARPPQRPQQRRSRRSQQMPEQQLKRKVQKAKSLEEMLQEIYNETNTPKQPPVEIEEPFEHKMSDVETYDDDLSYDEKYESYDVHAHDREAQYEGEVYEKRKQKELAEIIYKRQNKQHLSGTMKAQKRVDKHIDIKNFKFNAKDAVIYDIIMNRPKF